VLLHGPKDQIKKKEGKRKVLNIRKREIQGDIGRNEGINISFEGRAEEDR
jgi:hypothetical protein